MGKVFAILVPCALLVGCTHMQLQRDTLGQFRTVSDLHQQQVLDNLAMFVYDPNSMPYFNVLGTGINEVTDTGSAQNILTFARVAAANLFMVSQDATTLNLQRVARENWSATPVNDPRRLELMRCAYQKVVSLHCCRPEALGTLSAACPDCELRWKGFYGVGKDNRIDSYGRVTSDCLGGAWFGAGGKKDVPKGCHCQKVGSYCGVYVWVLPGGEDELAKLTLAILDFAVNQPVYGLTKDVTLNLDANGKLVPSKDAVRTIKATIPIEASSYSLLKNEMGDVTKNDINSEILKKIEQPLPRPPETYQNSQPPDFQFLNQRLQQITPPR